MVLDEWFDVSVCVDWPLVSLVQGTEVWCCRVVNIHCCGVDGFGLIGLGGCPFNFAEERDPVVRFLDAPDESVVNVTRFVTSVYDWVGREERWIGFGGLCFVD